MFERGSGSRQGPVEVEIAFQDGQRLNGIVVLPPGRTLPEVLNGTATFIEFKPTDGERMFIAKSALHSLTPANSPLAPDLWAGPTQGSSFDPYAILGIDKDSTREQARDAYLKLAKLYHPDRYEAADLPREVRDYLAVMVRRINAAHDAVAGRMQKKAAIQEPVFTKPGHG
jgi:DnaJ domain